MLADNFAQRTAINNCLRNNAINRFWVTMSFVSDLNKKQLPNPPDEYRYNAFNEQVGNWSDPDKPKVVKSAFLDGETLVSFKR